MGMRDCRGVGRGEEGCLNLLYMFINWYLRIHFLPPKEL